MSRIHRLRDSDRIFFVTAGMNQDTAANVYDFPAREYGIQERWPSPEHRGPRRADFARWGGGPAGLAAVDPMDPQTWNRYAYVRNSPLEFTDPMGTFADSGNYKVAAAFGATYAAQLFNIREECVEMFWAPGIIEGASEMQE